MREPHPWDVKTLELASRVEDWNYLGRHITGQGGYYTNYHTHVCAGIFEALTIKMIKHPCELYSPGYEIEILNQERQRIYKLRADFTDSKTRKGIKELYRRAKAQGEEKIEEKKREVEAEKERKEKVIRTEGWETIDKILSE